MTADALAELVVVVIDDDDDQRFLLRRLFARRGITQVHEAGDGVEAVEVVGRHQPDLVVLDLAMPVRSGFEALPDLRRVAPGTPVVVLSNLPRRRWEPSTADLGAVGFVEKRIPTQGLIEHILVAAALLAEATRRLSADLPAERGAPGLARRVVRGELAEDDLDVLQTVELLVSELVTNAVLHGSSAPRLQLVLSPDLVRVEVYDDDPTMPRRRTPDADRPGGRGLHLLDAAAADWGAAPHGAGKVVWFEVARTS